MSGAAGGPSAVEVEAWLNDRARRVEAQAKALVALTAEGKQADARQACEFVTLYAELNTVAWLKGVRGPFVLLLGMLRLVAQQHPLIVLPD